MATINHTAIERLITSALDRRDIRTARAVARLPALTPATRARAQAAVRYLGSRRHA